MGRYNVMVMARILVVDDERAIRNTLKEVLEFENYTVDTVESATEALTKLKETEYNLIYSDIKMEGMDGMELLSTLKSDEQWNTIPVVMISGHGTVENAVEAIKKGAYDFIMKPLDLNRLLITTQNALTQKALLHQTTVLKKKIASKNTMVGESKAIQSVREIIDKVAPTDARVLITGENGTGKEIVARMLHEQSQRHDQPLVEVNCAAIPSELIESELFGHMKGSFTGAIKDRAGKFEQAEGGTLFLDEIGDMSLPAQTKVLRALQESEITRVGSDKVIKVNVRVIAATNKHLDEEIKNGNFREDLFHRLNVIPIHIPALKERTEDIPLLVDYFLQQICSEQGIKLKTISSDAVKELQTFQWPGNIRELRNVIERLIILSEAQITLNDIKKYV